MIRILMIFAGILLVGSGALTRFLDSAVTPTKTRAAVVAADAPREQTGAGRTTMLDSGRDAHFEASARIGGRSIDFIVDTGATLVILRESDAARIGIRPSRADYTATVSTANGKTKAAPATLDRVEQFAGADLAARGLVDKQRLQPFGSVAGKPLVGHIRPLVAFGFAQ